MHKTGKLCAFATFSTSFLDLVVICTCPPTTRTGFFAFDNKLDTSLTFSGKAKGGFILIRFTSSDSILVSKTSVGIAITTGPGIPLSAM